MKLSKFFSVICLALTLTFVVSVNTSFAATNKSVHAAKKASKNQSFKLKLAKKTNTILENPNLTKQQKDKLLSKMGWKTIKQPMHLSPMTNVGCGSIYTTTQEYKDPSVVGRYYYRVEANFNWNSSCTMDTNSSYAPDVMGIRVVNRSTGNRVDASPYSAGINVYDSNGTVHSTNGSVSQYAPSGYIYSINDVKSNSIFSPDIGTSVQSWFYITQPSDWSNDEVKAIYYHTWADTQTSLSSASFDMTDSGSVTLHLAWSTSTQPKQWSVVDPNPAYFTNSLM